MKKQLLSIALLTSTSFAMAQKDSIAPTKIPFDGMDLSWINGQSRVKNPPLVLTDKTTGETLLNGSITLTRIIIITLPILLTIPKRYLLPLEDTMSFR